MHSQALLGQGRDEGFSLLETLISITITALLGVVILSIYSDNLQRFDKEQRRLSVLNMMENHFERLGVEIPVKVGNYNGTYNQNTNWELKINYYTIDTAAKTSRSNYDLLSINLIAHWVYKNKEYTEHLESLKRKNID